MRTKVHLRVGGLGDAKKADRLFEAMKVLEFLRNRPFGSREAAARGMGRSRRALAADLRILRTHRLITQVRELRLDPSRTRYSPVSIELEF